MQEISRHTERRTATDLVFEQLHEQIVSLQLLPGSKLSEAEVARKFGVSRQPVRDAFNRLDNIGLVLIRPQKATQVRGFSMDRVEHARFVRLSVELEVIARACKVARNEDYRELQDNLDQQTQALDAGNTDEFHSLDLLFHSLICELADCPMAVDTIKECKMEVDRLCVLSLKNKSEAPQIFQDHIELFDAVKQRNTEEAVAVARRHFSRIDETIADIHNKHSDYFE